MSPQFGALPTEVEACILSYLDYYDLVQLERTSKHFYHSVIPLLWNEVEIHRPSLHEQILFKETFNYQVATESGRAKNYIKPMYPDDSFRLDNLYAEMATRFLRTFDPPQGTDLGLTNITHREQVAKRIRSLCMDVAYRNEIWDEFANAPLTHIPNILLIFSQFQNLESLDLTFQWPYDRECWDKSTEVLSTKLDEIHRLQKLRVLRLRGYVPAPFVRWSCSAANKLIELELAILDRPIGSTLCYERVNPPLKSRRNNAENTNDDDTSVIDEESDSGSEDFDHEQIAPRPLATLCETDIPEQLNSLSSLTLRRPVESALHEGDAYYFHDPYTSTKSDENILFEWARLVRSTRRTIKHLVFDQRPAVEEIEQDGTGNNEFLVYYPYGPGYRRFRDIVLPALLEDAEWPRLESIQFYGFEVTEDMAMKYCKPPVHNRFDECSFFPRVQKRFKALNVDIAIGLGARMLFQDETGAIQSGGDGFGLWDFVDLEDQA